MALAFFRDWMAPVLCAKQIAIVLRTVLTTELQFTVRMGIHSGPIYRDADINASMNIVGGGINSAQRVMDLGDGGHILISKGIADTLLQLSAWKLAIHDLGEAKVKHGEIVHVFNLFTEEFGNPNKPSKIAAEADMAGNSNLRVRETAPPRASRWRRQIIAGVAGLLAVGAGGYLIFSRSVVNNSAIKLTQITDSGHVTEAALSPDGKYLAYEERHDDGASLFVRQMAAGNSVKVLGPEQAGFDVTFSRNGDSLFVVKSEGNHEYGLYQMPILGGAPKKLLSNINSPVAFSPDAKQMVFSRDESRPNPGTCSLILSNVDGSGEKVIATHAIGGYFSKPRWSPDAKTIGAIAPDGIALIPAAGGSPSYFQVPGWMQIESFEWLPLGRGFLLTAEEEGSGFTAHHQVLEVSYPDAKVTRVTNDLGDHHSMTATTDLSSLAVVDLANNSNIWVAPSGDPTKAQRINEGRSQGFLGVAWSKDGRIVFSDNASTGWVMNADGSALRPFTADRHSVRRPIPCGPGPLFSFAGGGTMEYNEFYVGDPDGRALRKIVKGNGTASCTPDGQWMIYYNHKSEIWEIPLAGGEPVRLFENAYNGLPSDDGKWMAIYQTNPGNPTKLVVKSMTGGPDAKLAETTVNDLHLHWNLDSTGLTIVKTKNEVSNLWNLPLGGGPAKQLTYFPSDHIWDFAWSPDGRLAIARGLAARDIVLIQRK